MALYTPGAAPPLSLSARLTVPFMCQGFELHAGPEWLVGLHKCRACKPPPSGQERPCIQVITPGTARPSSVGLPRGGKHLSKETPTVFMCTWGQSSIVCLFSGLRSNKEAVSPVVTTSAVSVLTIYLSIFLRIPSIAHKASVAMTCILQV